jgi:hypothetical protein
MSLQSLKKQCKWRRVKVKRTQLRRFREARREVSGSDGLGGILGRQDTYITRRREKDEKNLFGSCAQTVQTNAKKRAVQEDRCKKRGGEVREQMELRDAEGLLGNLLHLGRCLGTFRNPNKHLRLQRLSTKGKKGWATVQRRNFRGKGDEKRGIDGVGVLGGIKARAETKQQGCGSKKRTFLAPGPRPSKKDLK